MKLISAFGINELGDAVGASLHKDKDYSGFSVYYNGKLDIYT